MRFLIGEKGKNKRLWFWPVCFPLTEMGKTVRESSSEVRSSFGHVIFEISIKTSNGYCHGVLENDAFIG